MTVDSDARSMTEYIWSYWAEKKIKPAITWIELYQICRFFFEECKNRDLDPQEFDLRAELDATLNFSEMKEHVKGLLAIKPSPEEYLESELARMAAGTEFTVIKEKDLEKLLGFEQKFGKLQEQVKRLKQEKEIEASRREEALKEVEALRKRPAFKIRILQNFREGIFYYTKGSVVETHNIDWALKKIDEGLAERVSEEVPIKAIPEVPPKAIVKPRVPVTTIRDRERYLTDVFIATLSKHNVPIRPEYRARFRVELPSILGLSEKEQETVTEQFSMNIVREYQSKVDLLARIRRREAPPEPEKPVKMPPGWTKVEGGYLAPNGVFVSEEEYPKKVAAIPVVPKLKPPAASLWRWLFDTYKDMLNVTEEFPDFRTTRSAFFRLPKEEQKLLIKQFRDYFPEVRSISLKDWLEEVKGILWDDYVKLPDREKADLIDEYAYYS